MYRKKLKHKILSILASGLMAAGISFGAVDLPALLSANPVYAEDSIEESTIDGGIEDNTEAGTSTTDERSETSTSTTIEDVGATDTNEIGNSEEMILTGASESQPLSEYAASAIKMETPGYFYPAENTITATYQYGGWDERENEDGTTDYNGFKTGEATSIGALYSLQLPAHTAVGLSENGSGKYQDGTDVCNRVYVFNDLSNLPIIMSDNSFNLASNGSFSIWNGKIYNTSSSTQTYYIWIVEPTLPFALAHFEPFSIPDTTDKDPESKAPFLSLGDNQFSKQNIITSFPEAVEYYEDFTGEGQLYRYNQSIISGIYYQFTVPAGKIYKLSGKGDGTISGWTSDGIPVVGDIYNLHSDYPVYLYLTMDSNGAVNVSNEYWDDSSQKSILVNDYLFRNDSENDQTFYIRVFPEYEPDDSETLLSLLHVSTLTLEDVTYSSVTSEVKPIGTAPAASMNITTEALADAVLTDEEKKLQVEGADVDIYLEIEDITSKISEADKNKVADVIASTDTVGMYTDINLYKKVGDHDAVKITKIQNNKLSISLTLPDTLKNTDTSITRTYKIVRLHDGKGEVLDTKYDTTAGTLTFETDAFSVYAIVYTDTKNNSSTSDNVRSITTSPKTGDSTPIIHIFILLSFTLIIGVSVKLRYQIRK